jgi:dTDP-4-dehydrorhamnose reductase
LFHVVNQGETTWYDFARRIFAIKKLDVQVQRITTAEYGAPAPRPRYSVLSTKKYDALGGPKLRGWETALADYLSQGA